MKKEGGLLDRILKIGKDILFPVFCLECKKEGFWLCLECKPKLKTGYIKDEKVISLTQYKETSLVGKLIHTLKYNYVEDVMLVFEEIINDFVRKYGNEIKDFDFITAIPLHKRRMAERGFNQAELLAQALSRAVGIPYNNLAVRHKKTEIQTRLNKGDRVENVAKAFSVINNSDVKNKKIILVDDVYTTGSTMNSCAKVLLMDGAKEVKGFVIARG